MKVSTTQEFILNQKEAKLVMNVLGKMSDSKLQLAGFKPEDRKLASEIYDALEDEMIVQR